MECMRNQLYEGAVLNGRYETIAPLNHGSFGMVFQARDMVTNEDVAIKVITKSSAGSTCPTAFAVDEHSEELGIHLSIASHPNVVNLVQSFETPHHIYLVLEFCTNGDLYEAIRMGKGPLETEHVREFMFQLVDAVEFMHSKGVYHRDIKPENIFLTQSGSLKLGDFGLATHDAWSWEIAVGSDRYMAPEQYDPPNTGYSTAKADVWAIGICLLNILFSRNPFAVPAASDPLYADFVFDRQTLFDVFPNMSQDTFEVLIQCMAIDPEKRDLSLVKEALDRVISFTTDDERLDDFCTEELDTVIVTANREPLRTPSVSTPQLDQGGSFPWAKALAMSPPQQMRQLSVIPDTEDLYVGSQPSGRGWFDVKPDTASTASFVDSGLGLSFKSTDVAEPISFSRSRPVPISGSLPVNVSRPFSSMASVFGKTRDAISKSWSDLWDEEEEEHALADIENNYLPVAEVKTEKPAVHSESGSGVSTPRGGLSELKISAIMNTPNRSRSPKRSRREAEHVSEHTGFVFEEHVPVATRYSPPSKRSGADKWAALGDRRRAQQQQTPQKQIKSPKQTSPAPTSARKRTRTGSWRRPSHLGPGHENTVAERKDNWTLSKDWRQHPNHSVDDGIGDLEWVGGWHDLHL
ncbi:kinase-like domain-containing protein [Massariosphaeria phaeospora]|uniref:non-specific serine/threonine protein kinase n=1 Tax=Massariosphaeria phaeospora TaxID=100035 RepID=A0A7C8MYY4_9PLEO|nr:kinase-like domain-containing protein [Massariosphaeria phaeospora]